MLARPDRPARPSSRPVSDVPPAPGTLGPLSEGRTPGRQGLGDPPSLSNVPRSLILCLSVASLSLSPPYGLSGSAPVCLSGSHSVSFSMGPDFCHRLSLVESLCLSRVLSFKAPSLSPPVRHPSLRGSAPASGTGRLCVRGRLLRSLGSAKTE